MVAIQTCFMIRQFLLLVFICSASLSNAQTTSVLHHGTFKKGKLFMHSNPYKPDDWEKPYYDSALKTVFPSDLVKQPDRYQDKMIHLMGVVEGVLIDSNNVVTVQLENKYWDYTEDYSIQDEVMFVSEKGEGSFRVTLYPISAEQLANIKDFVAQKKLFLVYGTFKGLANNYPLLAAQQVKYIDYELYTTRVFSYEVERDKNGHVVTDKRGKVQLTNFQFLKVAKAGQNK